MATLALKRHLIISLIVVYVAIEVALQLSDLGLIGNERLRRTAYEYGGFWPGLLGNWRPNFDAQPFAMFVTYSFLHGGLIHLLVNIITLWSLSGPVVHRVGGRGFALLYGASIIGGAMGYAAFDTGLLPMVGASGALFGLAGGLLAWSYVDRFTAHQGLWPVAQAVVMLIGLNFLLWWATSGQIAWQTHLGGFITGWLFANLIDPRPSTA
ncbi:MAG: rhomboid family intramembrane serine protease [Pseudomonadota bacterium]